MAVAGTVSLTVAATLLHSTVGTRHGTLTFNGFASFALTVLIFLALWYRRSPAGEPGPPAPSTR
ncbi:MAG: hypothetical protein KGQ88_06965 [Chloroflexi bacterium]|nr:hypothetical protein [Chloroflexota bacterium]